MNGEENSDAMAALHRLRQDTGGLIAEAIAPVDEAIRELGVPLRSSHYAEDVRDWNPKGCGYYQAHASRFAFAIEAAEGKVSEYCLCAAEGPDGQCGLYVSVCESRTETEPGEGEEGRDVVHRVVIDRMYLVKPDELSLALRAQMLDELHQGNFLRSYRKHVEGQQEGQPSDPVHRPWLPGWSG